MPTPSTPPSSFDPREKDGRVPDGTGLSSPTEPQERLGPSGFDPSRDAKCECQQTGRLDPNFADWYDAERELPFVNHAPGECACTNDLARYRASDGAIRWLCSCCNMFGDVRLSDSDRNPEGQDAQRLGAEHESAEGIAK